MHEHMDRTHIDRLAKITDRFAADAASHQLGLLGYVYVNLSETVSSDAQDDASGRQQFQFIPTAGGYSIVLPAGRPGCPGTYVTGVTDSAHACI